MRLEVRGAVSTTPLPHVLSDDGTLQIRASRPVFTRVETIMLNLEPAPHVVLTIITVSEGVVLDPIVQRIHDAMRLMYVSLRVEHVVHALMH